MLCPQVGLHTENVLLLLFSEFIGHDWLKAIHLTARHNVAACGAGLLGHIFQLGMVNVGIDVGTHDDTVVLTGSFYAALHSFPRHDDRTFSKTAVQYFIPTNEVTPTRRQEFFHLVVDVRLQLVFRTMLAIVNKPQLLDLCLAFLALAPSVFRTFVAADMYIFRRENVA